MLIDDFENAKITVDKEKLLERLRANLVEHAAEAQQARAGYRKLVLEELRRMALQIENGGAVRSDTGLKAPVSHEKDYQVAISMLEWSKAEQIVISSGQFRQYVRDEWDWKAAFKNETSRYLGG